ncbi:sigma-70 family RNA polymerase sigma factor [Sphingomonas swuensis]|uniref:sigma-70 family RNA polymerase sigma factor n=1 Tax=Sphingomonas swuensis TaxID=977800 RepID=UPI0031E096B7
MITLHPLLFRYASKLCGNRDQAEDLVQETFARALRFDERFEPGTNLLAWLFVVCRNIFLSDRRRARHQSPWHDSVAEQLLITQPHQQQHVELLEVAALLERLPTYQREALVSIVLEGATYEELAKSTGRSLGTIKTWVHRARVTLSKAVEGTMLSRHSD